MNPSEALQEYLKEHKYLSGEIERELKRFVEDIEKNYVGAFLKQSKCACGEMFLPTAKNNKWCVKHAANVTYQRKMKSFETP